MTHTIAALLHYLSSRGERYEWKHVTEPWLCGAVGEAIKHRWVIARGPENSLDYFWCRLTAHGEILVAEGVNAMEAVS